MEPGAGTETVVLREDVSFESCGATCAAWLYRPEGAPRPAVVILAHGLGATRDMRLDAFAERFVGAGHACLVFDYRHFGASGGEPRQWLDIGRQRDDWHAALRWVRRRADLDVDRIALWGTSFAGGHVIAVAASDPGVRAVIAQCPFTDGLASALAMHPLAMLKVMPLAVADQLRGLFGGSPILVPAAGPPGSAALMTAPDALDGYRALQPAGQPDVQIAARIALQVLWDRPGRHAARLRCPALFCVCDDDSVAPAAATLRHAARAPFGEIRRYPVGHFDIYRGEPFERVVADQLLFLARHLPAATLSPPTA